MRSYVFLVLAASVALAPMALGSHCTTYSTSLPEYDTKLVSEATGQPRLYADDDCFPLVACWDVFFSFWIYEESNGIDGLQRGDEWQDDTCHGLIAPDKLIF